jgi:hypothetical protein
LSVGVVSCQWPVKWQQGEGIFYRSCDTTVEQLVARVGLSVSSSYWVVGVVESRGQPSEASWFRSEGIMSFQTVTIEGEANGEDTAD